MQTWVRTLRLLGMRAPQPLQSWLGIGGWHGDDPTPGACCLGFEDGTELRPARIADALGEVAVPYQVGDPQVFQIDGVVVPQQRQRGLVVEVGALPLAPSDARVASQPTAFARRWLPFLRRETRRCAFASCFSPRR